MKINRNTSRAFTIVELIVVIVVLGILAGIVVTGFGSWQTSVAKKAIQSDLKMAVAAMQNSKNFGDSYPSSMPSSFKASSNVTITLHSSNASDFCIDGSYASKSEIHYYVDTTKGKDPRFGTCTNGDEDEGSSGGGGSGGGGTSPSVAIAYSDDFTGSGALGNVKTGDPTLAWQFLNSSAANWTRNSSGYTSSSVAASSNPMAITDVGAADVAIVEGVRSTGNAIYFRVTDATNWLRTRITQSTYYQDVTINSNYTIVNYRYATSCDGSGNCTYANGSTTVCGGNYGVPGTITSTSTGGPCSYVSSVGTTYYNLITDKSVAGTVTQLASYNLGSSLPAFIKVLAKDANITISYGSTSSATSSASTVTSSVNQSATKHGIGYASSSEGSPSGVKSVSITNAP